MEEKPLPANVEPIPKDTAPAKPAKDAAPESAGESKASGAPSEPKDPEAPAASSAPAATPCLPAFLWFGKGKGRKSTAEQVEEALQKLKEEMRAENEALRAQMEKQTELLEDNAEELRQLREEVKGLSSNDVDPKSDRWRNYSLPEHIEKVPYDLTTRVSSSEDTRLLTDHFSEEGAFRLLLHVGAARAWRRAGCGFTASATRFLEFVREIIEAESARSKRSGRHEQNAYLGVLRELTAGDILNCITREAVRHATDDPNPESNPADEQEGVVRVMELRHMLLDSRFGMRSPVSAVLVTFLGISTDLSEEASVVGSAADGATGDEAERKSNGRRRRQKRKLKMDHRTMSLRFFAVPPSLCALYAEPVPSAVLPITQQLRDKILNASRQASMGPKLAPTIISVTGKYGSGRTELVKQALADPTGVQFLKENFAGGCAYVRLSGDDTTREKFVNELALALCMESEADGISLIVQMRDYMRSQGKMLLVVDDFPANPEKAEDGMKLLYDDLLQGSEAKQELFGCVIISETPVPSKGLSLEISVDTVDMPRLANDAAQRLIDFEAPALVPDSINVNAKARGNPLSLLSMCRTAATQNTGGAQNVAKKSSFGGIFGGLSSSQSLNGESAFDVWTRLPTETREFLLRLAVIGNTQFTTALATAVRSTSWVAQFVRDSASRRAGQDEATLSPTMFTDADMGTTIALLRLLERGFFVEEEHQQAWRLTQRAHDLVGVVMASPASAAEGFETSGDFASAVSVWLHHSAEAYTIALCHTMIQLEELFRSRGNRRAAVARFREELVHVWNLLSRLRTVAQRQDASAEKAKADAGSNSNSSSAVQFEPLAASETVEKVLGVKDAFQRALRSIPCLHACVEAFSGTVVHVFLTPQQRQALWRDIRWVWEAENVAEVADETAVAPFPLQIKAALGISLTDCREFKSAIALLKGVITELRKRTSETYFMAYTLYCLARATDGEASVEALEVNQGEKIKPEKVNQLWKSKSPKPAEKRAAQNSYEQFLKSFEAMQGSDDVNSATDRTLDLLQESLSLFKRLGLEISGEAGLVLHCMGSVQAGSKNLNESLRLLRSALEVQRKALGEEHPDVSSSLSLISIVQEARGEYR